jgi:hypothetical protein
MGLSRNAARPATASWLLLRRTYRLRRGIGVRGIGPRRRAVGCA